MLRVFSTPSGERLCSLRRGAAPTCIRSLSFSPDGRFLAVSSDTPTVHIFRLQHEAAAGAGATADAHAARGHAARRPSGGAVETGVGAGDLGSPPGVPLSAAAGAASAPLPIPGAARPSEGGHVVGSWQSAGSWCSELAGTPPTGPRLSRSGSDVDDEAGDVWSVVRACVRVCMLVHGRARPLMRCSSLAVRPVQVGAARLHVRVCRQRACLCLRRPASQRRAAHVRAAQPERGGGPAHAVAAAGAGG